MPQTAMILANDLLRTPFAKTTHGLVRGPSRYEIVGVLDPSHAGGDAGELIDGHVRGIPVFDSTSALLEGASARPEFCIVGVATVGGVLPATIHGALVEAAEMGMTLVNGLHQLLADDPQLVALCERSGARIIDIRRPKPTSELRFWSGEILRSETPRLAVLGTDCAVGKRTTTALLWQAMRRRGVRAEIIYTGQTGWLQGFRHGFILDATPNDFVCGELEGALLSCLQESRPELILIEGQSGLRNPAGPCGSELILGGAVHGVVLQHAPGRTYYEDLEAQGCRIPPVSEEVEMIRLMGSECWALTLNSEGVDREDGERIRGELASELGIPVCFPLREGVDTLVDTIVGRLARREVRS